MNLNSIEVSKKELRNFSLGAGFLFIFLSYLFNFKKIKHLPFASEELTPETTSIIVFGLIAISCYFILAAILNPNFARPVFQGWMKFAQVLGTVNTRIILTLLFVLVVTPIGLLLKIFGKDLLDQHLEKDKDTYWIPRDTKEIDVKRYFKHF